ncbi:hypothetical protein [Microcoleus vaginatus]|uniref:hypothetical protein n=1 Tax=Microcoleus vaginatus TaxID=119532 RepID=UPI001F602BB1
MTVPPLVNVMSCGPASDSPHIVFLLEVSRNPIKSVAVMGLQAIGSLKTLDRAF